MGLDQCRGESAATVCFVTKAIYVSMLHHTYCSQHKNVGFLSEIYISSNIQDILPTSK